MTDATPTARDLAEKIIVRVQFYGGRAEDLVDEVEDALAAHAAQAVAQERERSKQVADWLDTIVRAMLPSEHVNCGVDSGCSHARYETEAFEQLEEWVTALRAGPPGPA